MNIILLSGGSGKRLWPLSNDIRSKQFIKLFKHHDRYESMVQRVYRQITTTIPNSNITVATNKTQASSVLNQLDDRVNLCLEPTRRDTFPAIALVCAYLHDEQKVDINETVIIAPIDSYVEDSYFQSLGRLYEFACTNSSNLTLMGVEPTYPSEKYGYIIPENSNECSNVVEFKEKPTKELAQDYIKKGALWNCGVFAFKLGYILEIANTIIGYNSYDKLLKNYDTLNKISFDYAVVEKEKNIEVLRYSGEWKDIGTWNTLVEEMSENIKGDVILDTTCSNTHVINELPIPVLGMGLQDIIISCSSNGILVSNNVQSSFIKEYVEQIDDTIMFAEKSWGRYQVIDITKTSLTVQVTLNKDKAMNYHYHDNREEVWSIISGCGVVTLEGVEQEVTIGDVIKIPKGCKHSIKATSTLKLIEVQIGENISVKDKFKC